MLPIRWILFCVLLPWHKLRFVRKLGVGSILARCNRCGREYAFNDDVQVVLPYYEVREHFEQIERDLREAALL